MSLGFTNNLSALNAQLRLSSADKGLSRSINRLSSGLRINSAADDPSGLAMSQRLKTQFKGLDRAVMNSQDAISYMQTAESALNETQNILQRMRELSVQAANGTLTASDREQIQQEIDQLKDEVDRISTSTEFNTKKLLNGDASAIWSSSSKKINAVIRGKVREGNYELEINQTPAQNHVLKTDIFSVKDGVASVKNLELNGTKASVEGVANSAGATDLTFTFDDGFVYEFTAARTNSTAVNSLADAINNDTVLKNYVRASVQTIDSTGGVVKIEALREGEYGNSFQVVNNTKDTSGSVVSTFGFAASTAAQTFSAGKTSETGVGVITSIDHLLNGFEGTSAYTMTVDVDTGAVLSATATSLAAYAQTTTQGFTANSTIRNLHIDSATVETGKSGAYFMLEVLETKGNSTLDTTSNDKVKIRFSFDNGKSWRVQTINMSDYADTTATTGGVELTDGINTVRISTGDTSFSFNAGDKLLYGLNAVRSANDETVKVTIPISDGASSPATTQDSRLYNFVDGSLDKTTTQLDLVQLNTQKGEWNVGSMKVNFGENVATSGTLTFDVESGGIATSDTQLYKIAKFYDDNGNFILGTKGKYLTVYNSEGKSSKIFLDAMDTIGDVAKKITNAVKGDLGMATGDENVDKHIADFVNAPIPNSDEALQGTIVIRSPKMGDSGQLFFSGDEDLLNALSLVTIHKPGDYQATVTVKDAHTGEEIGSDTISNNEVHGVIKGVDILIDPMLDTNIAWDETDKKYRFTSAPGSTKEYLHIVDNAKSFQIGANKGQTMDSYIGEMSARSLNVNEILVVNQDVAQKSISILDDAIDKVSSERARLGAVINRLDFTIKNLSSQKESSISAFSRIVDLDVAKESVEFSKNQMLTQAAQSMLAQANKIPQNLLQLLR